MNIVWPESCEIEHIASYRTRSFEKWEKYHKVDRTRESEWMKLMKRMSGVKKKIDEMTSGAVTDISHVIWVQEHIVPTSLKQMPNQTVILLWLSTLISMLQFGGKINKHYHRNNNHAHQHQLDFGKSLNTIPSHPITITQPLPPPPPPAPPLLRDLFNRQATNNGPQKEKKISTSITIETHSAVISIYSALSLVFRWHSEMKTSHISPTAVIEIIYMATFHADTHTHTHFAH